MVGRTRHLRKGTERRATTAHHAGKYQLIPLRGGYKVLKLLSSLVGSSAAYPGSLTYHVIVLGWELVPA